MNDKLKVLLHAVAEVTNIDTATLRQHKSKTHKIAFAKHVFCYVGCIKLRFKQQDIGNYIGLSQSRVCQVTSRSNFMRKDSRNCQMKSDWERLHFENQIKSRLFHLKIL